MGLLWTLRPEWWFSAHLHTRYQACVLHDAPLIATSSRNPDEVIIEDDEFPTPVNHKPIDQTQLEDAQPTRPQHAAQTTFLALDKCLPKRQFLEVYPWL